MSTLIYKNQTIEASVLLTQSIIFRHTFADLDGQYSQPLWIEQPCHENLTENLLQNPLVFTSCKSISYQNLNLHILDYLKNLPTRKLKTSYSKKAKKSVNLEYLANLNLQGFATNSYMLHHRVPKFREDTDTYLI